MSDTTFISDEIRARLVLGEYDPYQFFVATLLLMVSAPKSDLDVQSHLSKVLSDTIDRCGFDQSTVQQAEDEVIALFAEHGIAMERLREW
ncbi:MAG: hypothetical protein ACOYN3_10515 [Acidimicrobiia bacterium]